jgi:cytochrome c-type biogenesis protein CcmH
LLRGRRRGAARDRAVVSLYRDQLRELKADHAAGSVSDEQFESGRRELERRLLEDVAQAAPGATVSRKVGWTAAVIGAFVLVVPIGLYLALGSPAAINPGSFASQPAGGGEAASGGENGAPHPITPEQVKAMVDKLAKHLEQSPRDGDGWAMLGRSYAYMRNFPGAVKAFQKAAELRPNDSRLFADYADALAMTQDQRLAGEPMKLIQRALAIDPKDVKALALAGTEAFDRRDYAAAVGFWEQAVKAGPPDQQFAQQLRAGLDEARKLAGGEAPPPLEASAPQPRMPAARESDSAAAESATASSGATVKGRVQLAATLAGKAAPTDTVFVFARAVQGPRMPLALLKRQVKDLPLEFALDDTMAMMPNMKLSNYSSVVIGARVSKGGDAMPASGDLQGFSDPVKVGTSGVSVKIDQVVP